jgi:16S rRNA (cytosine967-C5)-methyltransferase
MARPQFNRNQNSRPNPKPKVKIDLARTMALEVLIAVLDRGFPLDSSFDEKAKEANLGNLDVRFARHLVATTLRRMGQIDLVLNSYLEKPLEHRNREGLHILRMGICQILYMETADHAAVSTSVDLLNARKMSGIAKLSNAVLRKVVGDQDKWKERIANDAGLQRVSLPIWLRQRWIKAYGQEQVTEIAKVFLAIPPFDLTLRDSNEQGDLVEKLEGQALGQSTIRLQSVGSTITSLPGFETGQWWLQDLAATLPVLALGDVQGMDIADLCSAPGGKTLQLVAAGAKVISLDKSEHRLTRVHENLARMNLKADVIEEDVAEWAGKTSKRFDVVLLDAPCSATGTIRRHPDILWNRDPAQLLQYVPVQKDMLHASANLVKPGGCLLYAVCSQEPEEGERQVTAFLSRHPEFETSPISPETLPLVPEAISDEGWVRTLPTMLADQGGMDGFFFAKLKRKN